MADVSLLMWFGTQFECAATGAEEDGDQQTAWRDRLLASYEPLRQQ